MWWGGVILHLEMELILMGKECHGTLIYIVNGSHFFQLHLLFLFLYYNESPEWKGVMDLLLPCNIKYRVKCQVLCSLFST